MLNSRNTDRLRITGIHAETCRSESCRTDDLSWMLIGLQSGLILVWLLMNTSPVAAGWRLFLEDRAGFSAFVGADRVIVDSDGMFAADPPAGTGVSLTRAGTSAGQTWVYDIYDVDFANDPLGTVSPGEIGGDIADLDSLVIEKPVSQDGATGLGSWGVDSGSGATSTPNALLLDFTKSPRGTGTGFLGVDLIDFEVASEHEPGQVHLYRNGSLIWQQPFHWLTDPGDGLVHFLGVASDSPGDDFDQIAVVVGDDDGRGRGVERWAADRISFGFARTPEPSGPMLWIVVGILGGVWAGFRECRLKRPKSRNQNNAQNPDQDT